MKTLENIIKTTLGDGYKVEVKDYYHNNETKAGVLILDLKNKKTAPIFYLDRYFNSKKQWTPDEIAADIIEKFHSLQDVPTVPDITPEKVKEGLRLRVVGIAGNERMLEPIPYITIADDIAVFLQVILSQDETGTQSVKVTRDLLDAVKIQFADAFQSAKENTEKEGEIHGLGDVLGIEDEAPLILATNETFTQGAAVIACDSILDQMLDRLHTERMFVIPSSVHEILAGDADLMDADTLGAMVCDINAAQVAPCDRLTNSAYEYSRADGLRKIA